MMGFSRLVARSGVYEVCAWKTCLPGVWAHGAPFLCTERRVSTAQQQAAAALTQQQHQQPTALDPGQGMLAVSQVNL